VSGPIVASRPLSWLFPVSHEQIINRKRPINRLRRNCFVVVVTGTVYPPMVPNEEERGIGFLEYQLFPLPRFDLSGWID